MLYLSQRIPIRPAAFASLWLASFVGAVESVILVLSAKAEVLVHSFI